MQRVNGCDHMQCVCGQSFCYGCGEIHRGNPIVCPKLRAAAALLTAVPSAAAPLSAVPDAAGLLAPQAATYVVRFSLLIHMRINTEDGCRNT